jgi:hypothetical protein
MLMRATILGTLRKTIAKLMTHPVHTFDAETLQEADFKVMSLAECNAELSPKGGYVTNSNICVRSEKSAGCKVNLT